MKDLAQLIKLPIKVDVSKLTHQEREEFQKKLFEHGVRWITGSKDIDTRSDFNFIDSRMILTHRTRDNTRECFENRNTKEIKIETLQEILGITATKQFTKSDLKDGMVVVLRGSSDHYLVLNNRFIAYDGWLDFDSYSNDLLAKYVSDTEFDVMEVFEVVSATSLSIQHWSLKSIWKREEKSAVQIEIEQIQKQMDELNALLETLLRASV